MKLFGLIGYPLSHSFSPDYFKNKFIRENIKDVDYKLFPLQDVNKVHELASQLPNLSGFNITIPHKQAILSLLHDLDPVAEKTGAVNTVKIKRYHSSYDLIGYNTDVFGFREALKPLLNSHHSKALVLGTGGAAKAVLYALNELEIFWTLVSRYPGTNAVSYEALNEDFISSYPLIINTTPLGMHPFVYEFPPIPYQFLSKYHLLFDLVYNPDETVFMKKGRVMGARAINGLEMLKLQAERSWEIWNS